MELLQLEDIDKLKGKSCVVTIGMFDGVHTGHQQMLKELKSLSQRTSGKSVVITFSNHPRTVLDTNKNDRVRLLQTNAERYACIERYGVDYILTVKFTKEFAALSSVQFLDLLLQYLDIKVLLLGYDNRFGNPKDGSYERLVASGYYKNVKIEKDIEGVYCQGRKVSSTQIRNALVQGDAELAASMLCRYYNITSTIEKGLQNGRKLGFPTANIVLPEGKLLPKAGVYATKATVDNTCYNAITNIGSNPTFNAGKTTVETYIMDFDRDIYSKEMTVEFVSFIRSDKKFSSLEDLTRQIEKDEKRAREILQ